MNKDLEQMTIDFLRKHDAEYFKKKGKKSNLIEYPYLSERVEKDVTSLEIPLSNLSNKQRLQCPEFGDSHNFEEV